MPELKKNIAKFGNKINFKYEGILVHSFNRFYVVTKFNLPTINDLNFVPLDFDEKCNYLNAGLSDNQYWKEYITLLKILKDSCNLWNSTLVWFEDKLSSTTVDFFRSAGPDLKKSTVVDESLSSNQTNAPFQRLQLSFKIQPTVWEIYI